MISDRMTHSNRSWDAGEAGCGRLIMGLKRQIEMLRPGETLCVIARDPAASIDLEYWCHMTGHRLASSNPPYYQLQRKS